MQRLLPTLAAFALVIAGVVVGIIVLAARDRSGIGDPANTPAAVLTGPAGLPVGNVLVEYRRGGDRIRVERLAERLGALDTEAAREAGQAIVIKKVRGGDGVSVHTGQEDLQVPDATDPALAGFVQEHLGRTGT